MSDKDYSQLTTLGSFTDTDLFAIYPVGGPLKKVTFLTFKTEVINSLGSEFLTVADNLSDLNSASAARANLGLGSVATLASSAVFQVANNGAEVANASTFRSNIGAAASASPTITGGMTFSGSSKGNVLAIGALDIDWSAAEFQTKSISTNSTFTFSNITAAKGQGVALLLTISGGAEPTWPASVVWSGGLDPTWSNGVHLIGLVTFDGGVTVQGVIAGFNFG